ncbi:MAG: antA/AntB antirepressor family protein [Spirochaetota bacterium]
MNELIKIEERDGKPFANARELHQFLESKQRFSDWIKKRINKYGFVDGVDFTCHHKKMIANNATVFDYEITLDMAKELAMVENNERGREIRRYFIEVEHRARQAHEGRALLDPNIAALTQMVTQQAHIAQEQSQNISRLLGALEQQKKDRPRRSSRAKPEAQKNKETPSLPSLERSNIKNRIHRLSGASRYSEQDIYSCLYDNLSLSEGMEARRAAFGSVRRNRAASTLCWLEAEGLLPLLGSCLLDLEQQYLSA